MKQYKNNTVDVEQQKKQMPNGNNHFYSFDKSIKKIKLKEKINTKVLYHRKLNLVKSLFFKYDPITNSFYIPLSKFNSQFETTSQTSKQ